MTAPVSEKEWQNTVTECARAFGWIVWRTPRSKGTTAGEPDLRMVRAPRFIMAELKKQNKDRTPPQVVAAIALEGCPGVEYYLWRPSDWSDVQAVLR